LFGPVHLSKSGFPSEWWRGRACARWRKTVAVADELSRPSATAPAYDRQPPQDIPAEQSVLGGMLLSKDAIADVVEALQGPDFYRPAHQVIFDCILDLYGRGEPADAITVAAELNRTDQLSKMGGAVYLHTLIASTPTAANAGYYAAIVAEQAVLRRLVEAGTRVVQLGYGAAGGKGDVDDIVDRAQQEIYDVTEKRMSEDYSRLEDVLQPTMDELDAIASRGGVSRGVPTGIRDLDELTNGLQAGQMVVIAARPGVGKALALDTPVATPSGWTTMGEVAVGDQVIGSDGRPTTVVAATEVMAGRPCYEVHFSDGSVIVADAQHQWLTDTRASRKSAQAARAQYNGYRNQQTFAAVRTTEDIARTLRCEAKDGRLNHSVTNAAPLDLPDAALPLPSYALGVWLGDGTSAGAHYTSADPEIAAYIEAEGLVVEWTSTNLRYLMRLPARAAVEARPCPMCGELFVPKTSQAQTCGKTCGGKLRAAGVAGRTATCPDCGGPSAGLVQCQSCRNEHGSMQGLLRSLGVLGDKHIPTAYLRASVSQRRALLAGLMDTDGTVAPNGVLQFAVTNRRLAEDTRELIASLGHRVGMTTKQVPGRGEASSTCYTLTFSTEDEVFRLERKKLLHKERGARTFTARGVRFITEVRPIGSVPVRCIEVDAEDHLFLAGRGFIPTHNSTLGLDIARSATVKHHLPAAIFSLEMSKHEITMRLLSAEAKVPLHHMRAGTLSDEDWAKLARRMGEIADAPLYIDDSPNMTMMEIRAKARRLKQRNDLKLVVIDYLQLMTSGKRVESRQQEVSEFSRALKLLAKELEVPVIAMSQLNRGSEQRQDKKPMLSDLRESGSIEQDADMVMMIHREDMYEKESPRAGEADIMLVKHRNGPTANVTVAFQGHYSRFVDMAN
jgi:replicative DNA helicase